MSPTAPTEDTPRKRGRVVAVLLAIARRVVVIVVLTSLLLPLFVVVANSFRSRMPVRRTPGELGFEYTDVAIQSTDGVTLASWWIPAGKTASARTMLVSHGVGANRDDILRFCPFLHAAGYNILAWDWRGHGQSSWARVTFGLKERHDVRAALDWLKANHPREAGWIGALAISMGAAIWIQAAPLVPEVRAFVLDSPFASLRTMLPFQYRYLPEVARGPFARLTAFYAGLVIGTGVDGVAPVAEIASISPRPLFIIHGTSDEVIPHTQSQLLDEVARQPKEVWIVPGAFHTGVREMHPEEYHRRVLAFLERAW
ncbi:MAG: alpha/beta fold hydrolase [Candidatus Riflebacteria bacterium]|nr:alpha/beta fold hydrolase [Candidatus Riflebacteria bacterium]